MNWDTLLYASIVGVSVTIALVSLATVMGIRYKRELPKLPIMRSIEALELDKENVEADIASLEHKLRDAREQIEKGEYWSEWLERSQDEIDETRKEHEQIEPLRAELAQLKEDCESEGTRLNELIRECEQRTSIAGDLERQASELRTELAGLEELRDEHKQLEEKLAVLRQERSDLESSIAPLQADFAHYEKSVKELRDTFESLTKSVESARQLRDELEEKCEQLKASLTDLEDLREKQRALEETVRKLEGEADTKREQVESLHDKEKHLSNELQELETTRATLEGTNQALQVEQQRLETAVERLAQSYAEGSTAPEDSDPCQDLWIPYISEAQSPGPNDDENASLEKMRRSIEDAGLHMPERTLFAFHTALKNQDLAPITVLAGISGTGKSLLPTIYSRAMGLHFLNLPVQPSWNSPQDLFGFYNYIEHKYKPTPLARALLQFATWDKPDPVEPAFDDQLILVLLDEMNLARIEYYFSELLSRLELRRTIDENDDQERMKVAVPLEIPRAGADEDAEADLDKSPHIYIGRNVLFTGTMNEDESTLSLSDKVLDRSTVLRFGRPKQLKLSQPDLQSIARAEPLDFEAWSSWCALRGSGLPSEIDKLLNDELPDVMHELGAPLGHRTAQAIANYIQLYPKLGRHPEKDALADQIEQKVLPKVRGRDNTSIEAPMRRLQKIARDLEDMQLAEAINAGLSESDGYFVWNGIDRTAE